MRLLSVVMHIISLLQNNNITIVIGWSILSTTYLDLSVKWLHGFSITVCDVRTATLNFTMSEVERPLGHRVRLRKVVQTFGFPSDLFLL